VTFGWWGRSLERGQARFLAINLSQLGENDGSLASSVAFALRLPHISAAALFGRWCIFAGISKIGQDCESLTLLTRYRNHHQKENETAEKNKCCHMRLLSHVAQLIRWNRQQVCGVPPLFVSSAGIAAPSASPPISGHLNSDDYSGP
jgi:hypothetical protein